MVFEFLKKYHKVKPYSKLALIYDYMMRHVNYREWAEFINSILKQNGLESGYVLDISCGTGSFLKAFEKYGYSIYGSDFSPSMIEQARIKHKKTGNENNFYVRDMRELTFDRKFDCVVSLFDSINYLTEQDDVLKNFNSVSSILEDNGLYIFDICTEFNSIRHFDNYHERGEFKELYFTRDSYYYQDERIQVNDIKIIDKEQGEQKRELHRQRVYSPDKIRHIIERSPLRLLAMYDNFSFNPPTDETERIHIVLKKE